MSAGWREYLALLEESAGLADHEARQLADVSAAYAAEGRRLQEELARADRELAALRARNSRLQVGVRDVVRQLGLAVPAVTDARTIPAAQMADALRAAEYDLDHLRRSLDYFTPQATAAPAAGSVTPPPPPPPPPVPPERATLPVVPLIVGAGVLVVLVLLALVVLQ